MTHDRIRSIANNRGTAYAMQVAVACMDKNLIDLVNGLIEHEEKMKEAVARAKRKRQLAEARAKQQALLAKARRQGYSSPVLVYRYNKRGAPKFSGFVEARRRATPAWVPPAFLVGKFQSRTANQTAMMQKARAGR